MVGWRKAQKPMTTKAAKAKIAEPAARPSRPSVRFTALVTARISQHGQQAPSRPARGRCPSESYRVNDRVVCWSVKLTQQDREPDGHDEQADALGPLAEAEVALVADLDPVVEEADEPGADDGEHHEDARAGEDAGPSVTFSSRSLTT